MGTIFLTTFKIEIDVGFEVFLLLLRGRFDLDVALMRGSNNFLADFTMDVPAAGMSFE
jgi:hypothetical protein